MTDREKNSDASLAIKSLIGWIKLIGGIGLLYFMPARDWRLMPAWIYLALLGGGVALITLYLWRHDRALLARRLRVGMRAEPQSSQKLIMVFVFLSFMLPVFLSALDQRWHAPASRSSLMIVGDASVIAGLALVFLTFRANSFAAATVRIETGHPVISTGPYALVRHPMYTGLILTIAGTPPALNSYAGLLGLPFVIAALAWRLLDEERLLKAQLPGYSDYCRRVRARLLPGVW